MLVTFGADDADLARPRRIVGDRRRDADRAVFSVLGDWPASWPTATSARGCCKSSKPPSSRRCSAPQSRCSPAIWCCRSSRCSCSARRRRFRARCDTRCCRSISNADELVDGNALIEGGTFLAILFGTIAGGHRRRARSGAPRRPVCCCCSCARLRVRREPARAARPGALARIAPQPQPGRRDRRDPAPGLGAPRRQAVDPRARRGSGWSARCSCRRSRPSPKETLGAGSGVVTCSSPRSRSASGSARYCAGG